MLRLRGHDSCFVCGMFELQCPALFSFFGWFEICTDFVKLSRKDEDNSTEIDSEDRHKLFINQR